MHPVRKSENLTKQNENLATIREEKKTKETKCSIDRGKNKKAKRKFSIAADRAKLVVYGMQFMWQAYAYAYVVIVTSAL